MIWILVVIPRYLGLFLTWPVLGSTFLFVFIYKFSKSIEKFLTEHKMTSAGPGGVTFEPKQLPSLPKDDSSTIDLKEDSKKGKEELEKEIEALRIEVADKVKVKEGVEMQVKTQQQLTELYEFAYLALFFVDRTKKVLKWFYESKNSQITKDFYNQVWLLHITDPNQRETIFNVLNNFGMINGIPGGAYLVTDKGERFLKSINFIKEN